MILIKNILGAWFIIEPLDYVVYIFVAAVTIVSLTTLIYCRKYYLARIREALFGMTRYLEVDETSRGTWKATKAIPGVLRTKIGDYYLRDPPIKDDGSFYICSRGFSMNVSLDKAAAIATLRDINYNTIADALEKYDEEYYNKIGGENKIRELLEKEKQQNPDKKDEELYKIILKDIKIEGIKTLLRLQWVTPLTIPLNVIYRDWCYRESADSIQNKNITDALINLNDQNWIKKITNAKIGIPLSQWVLWICALLVCAAIAYAIIKTYGGTGTNELKEVAANLTTN